MSTILYKILGGLQNERKQKSIRDAHRDRNRPRLWEHQNGIKYLFKTIFAIVDRIADEMEEVRVDMRALEYDRLNGYPDENTMQKQMQTYRALEVKAADLDQEKLNEKRMSIRPKKEEIAKTRISDLYGYCLDNLFRASKNAVAKRLGELPANIEKQEPNKQTVPTPSWLRGRKKKDDRDER